MPDLNTTVILNRESSVGLQSDTPSPGPLKVYGTDSEGNKGWRDNPPSVEVVDNTASSIGVGVFGVVGNGVRNDRLDLLSALQNSSITNKPVCIPGGMNVNLGGGTLTIPANAVLEFNGGFISNGTIVGTKTTIKAPLTKIFATDVTLQGTFNMEYIAPQHFGAITNSSTTVYSNSCSTEIQKCLDSPINVFLPQGFYYTTSPVYMTRPKSFIMDCTNQIDSANINQAEISVVPDHARIYTNQNINIITIRSKGVKITGTFDTTKVTAYTDVVIKYDLNYKMWGSDLDVRIYGNPVNIAGLNKGGTAILFDQSNLNQDDGYVLLANIKGYIQYYNTGIRIEADSSVRRTYINWVDINVDMNGCKKFIDADSGNESRYQGRLQCRAMLGTGEEAYPCIRINNRNSYVNCFPYDLGLAYAATYGGGQGNTVGFSFEGSNTQVGHFVNYYIHTPGTVLGLENLTSQPVLNTSESFIPWEKLNINNFVISALDNELVAFDKRHTVTIKKFKGAGINFTTALDPTPGAETNDITTITPENLFQPEDLPLGIVFNTNADLDNDFVEIEMTPSSGTFQWLAFWLNLYQVGNYFKKIQIIEHYQDLTKQSFIKDVNSGRRQKNVYFFNSLPNKASTKTIIRFIGASVKTTPLYVQDICATRARHQTIPYIHINGNQRIYGPLTTTQYKVSALNAAPSSASAPGTTGETRITSDYIYVCTATNTWKRSALTTW